MATLSASRIGTWLRCQKKYEYKYLQRLSRKEAVPALFEGSVGHKALELYYKGQDWIAAIREADAAIQSMPPEAREKFASLPKDMYRLIRGYTATYKEDTFVVVDVEREFEVVLPGGHVYRGVIDLVIRDERGLWIWDHKFVTTIPDAVNINSSDTQTTMYFDVGKELYGEEPAGVCFNYISRKPPAIPDRNKDGSISRKAIKTDLRTYFAAVKAAGQNPEDYRDMVDKLKGNIFYKRLWIPRPSRLIQNVKSEVIAIGQEIDRERSLYPRVNDFLCRTNCEYYELCQAELMGVDSTEIRAHKYDVREEEEDERGGEGPEGV